MQYCKNNHQQPTMNTSYSIPSNPFNLMNINDLRNALRSTQGVAPAIELSKKRALHEVYAGNTSPPGLTVSPQQTPKQEAKRGRFCSNSTGKVKPSKIGIKSYGPNDVLSGRGGGTNQHEGNCYFRSLVNRNRERYLRAKKNDKPFISLSIVRSVRERNGRFLKKIEKTGLWVEIGDDLAREKTSQALRQRAPEYRKQLFEEDLKSLQKQQPLSPLSQTSARVSCVSDELLSSANTSIPKLALRVDTHSAAPLATSVVPPALSRHHQQEATSNLNYHASVLNSYSATIRQAQIQEARKALHLQEKINALKVLELAALLKSSSSTSSRVNIGRRRSLPKRHLNYNDLLM